MYDSTSAGLFCCSNCSSFSYWGLFTWFLSPFIYSCCFGVFFSGGKGRGVTVLFSGYFGMLQDHLVYFLLQFYNQAFLWGTLACFWRMLLETKIWLFSLFLLASKDSWLSKAKVVAVTFVFTAHVEIKYINLKLVKK